MFHAIKRIVMNNNLEVETARRRFGTERDVAAIARLRPGTLAKDRCSGRNRFPFYKVRRRVLYDLDEVEAIIRRTGQGGVFVLDASAEAVR